MRTIWLVMMLIPMCLAAMEQRLVSLSPHTTELAFALGAGEQLLAVSEHSDYPPQAQHLPTIADHQGINFEAIVRLKPDLILAWQGGNKPQDLQRLAAMGFTLFYSHPQQPMDIADEIIALGQHLGKQALAEQLAMRFRQQLLQIQTRFSALPARRVFYYLWPAPLMSIGQNAWASHLLSLCHARNVFADAVNDYPQVTMEGVIARRPQMVVAALHAPQQTVYALWRPWLDTLQLSDAQVVMVDPDLLHRFSLRLPNGVQQLCEKIHQLPASFPGN